MESATALDPSPILELRQYTLHPGKRDTLIDLFDRTFVDPQEDAGMRVLGQFRDLDDPDRFVWLRGFPDHASRAARLESFYTGPVWKAHRDAANATMIDSDNVLLLRPLDPASSFILPRTRPAPTDTGAIMPRTDGALADPDAFVLATIYLLRAPADDAFQRFFSTRIAPLLAATGATPLARFCTDPSKNEFPGLPVREGEHAFVWFTSFPSAAAYDHHRAELERSPAWTRNLLPELTALCLSQQLLRLAPTERSLLRHTEPLGYTLHRQGDVHDFDFLVGSWNVTNRRLVARNTGCTDWDEFPAHHTLRPHLGGIANVDEMDCPTKGWSGMTLRHFHLARRQWTIYWISSKTGAIDPGVVGGFEGDRGEFYGEDTDDGTPVKVRFIWLRLTPTTARWEQSFSYNNGPWERNWIMDFAAAPPSP